MRQSSHFYFFPLAQTHPPPLQSEHKYDKMVRKYDSQGHAGLTPDGLVEYFVRKDEGRIWEDLMLVLPAHSLARSKPALRCQPRLTPTPPSDACSTALS